MQPPFPIPAFEDNYIWALVGDDGEALVVDPGDAAPVSGWLKERGAQLGTVLITHHHPDHIGGLAALRGEWPGLVAVGPQDPRIPGLDRTVVDGDEVDLPALNRRFEVIAVPGHTLTHVAYSGEGELFCGDTLFSLGCGRLFEGSPAQMLASLDRLAALPDDTSVYCTHEYTTANGRFAIEVEPGNPELRERVDQVAEARAADRPSLPSTMLSERQCNPFLRCDRPEVRRSVAAHAGIDGGGRLACFAALRNWKDGFRG